MNFTNFKRVRSESFVFALVVSAALGTLQSHAQDAFEVLSCDPTIAGKQRDQAQSFAGKAVAEKLQVAGVIDTNAQTRIIEKMGDLVLDLQQMKASSVGKVLQGAKPKSDEQFRRLLRQNAAVPIRPAPVVPSGAPLELAGLHPATSKALSDAALFSGVTHIARAQLPQLQAVDLRNKNVIDWTSPLGSLAGATVMDKILRQGSEKNMLVGARPLIAGGDNGWRANDSIRLDLSRLLAGRGGCLSCNTGEPLQGSETATSNSRNAPQHFKSREVPWSTGVITKPATDADVSCAAAFNKFNDAVTSQEPDEIIHDANNNLKPVNSLETFALWAQTATDAQFAKSSLLGFARAFVAKCQPTVVRLEPLNENDVTRFVGAIGAPISALGGGLISPGQREPSFRTCTGTLISASTVLTARHCFMSSIDSKPDKMLSGEIIKQHWFELDSGEPFRYQVCGINSPSASSMPVGYWPANDWIEVTIAEPKGERARPYKPELADVRMDDRLHLPGVNILLPQSVAFPPLTTTEVTGCNVMAITNSCVLHNCQTLPVMSGAPVFLKVQSSQAGLKLVGIHLGGRHGYVDKEDIEATGCDDTPSVKGAVRVIDLRNMAVRANQFINIVAPK